MKRLSLIASAAGLLVLSSVAASRFAWGPSADRVPSGIVLTATFAALAGCLAWLRATWRSAGAAGPRESAPVPPEVERERERERRLARLATALAAQGGVDQVAGRALRALADFCGAAGGILWVVGEPDEELIAAASFGIDPAALAAGADHLVREVSVSGRLLYVDLEEGAGRVVRSAIADLAPRALLVAPLTASKRLVGVVELAGASPARMASEQDLTRATTRVAAALRNALAGERTIALARALAERRAQLNTVFEALTDAVILVDAAGAVQLYNPAAQHLAAAPLGGSDLGDVHRLLAGTRLDGTAVAQDESLSNVVLGRGEPVRDAIRTAIAPEGDRRVLSLTAVPIRAGGPPVGAVIALRDITEEHALRETLAKANEDLRKRNEELKAQDGELRARTADLDRASRLKSDFLASMSHELRTPLNAVIGFSDLLQTGSFGLLSPKQKTVVGDILGAAQHLLTLINDVLDLSKIEAGRLEVSTVRVDVADEITGACGLLGNAATKKGLRLMNCVDRGTVFVAADPDRLRQVLINLVSNAVKFTPEGGQITVEAQRLPGRIRLSVNDTGIGIAPEDASKLFSPFSQLESGYARRFQGTGLGLSICKRLVELMGGEIGFTSEPGQGSTFSFTLPAAAEAAGAASRPLRAPRGTGSAPPASAARGASAAGDAATSTVSSAPDAAPASGDRPTLRIVPRPPPLPGHRPRVLVIDDSEMNRKVVRTMLGAAACEVIEAPDARTGMRLARERRPVLILMDLQMPDMDGFEATSQLKADPVTSSTPVIAVTAHAMPGHAERAVQVGCASCVIKPIARAKLLDAMDRAMGGPTWRRPRADDMTLAV